MPNFGDFQLEICLRGLADAGSPQVPQYVT